MSKSILYIEDEAQLAYIIKDLLESKGFTVYWLDKGEQALKILSSNNIDLIILDITLPDTNGFDLATKIVNAFSGIPILFTSAKNQSEDVIRGLKIGAKDYLKKPFNLEELVLRINNITGDLPVQKNRNIKIGTFNFNAFEQSLSSEEEKINLTYLESEILYYLIERTNQEIIKKELLLAIWKDDNPYNAKSLNVHINKLRRYLSADSNIKLITLRSLGYKFII